MLIEVNLAGETSKAGIAPEDLPDVVARVEAQPNLRLEGLMCIPPIGDGRRYFAALRALRDEIRPRAKSPLSHLSMGMSADFEAAIEEGATIVRVGTAVFGVRAP